MHTRPHTFWEARCWKASYAGWSWDAVTRPLGSNSGYPVETTEGTGKWERSGKLSLFSLIAQFAKTPTTTPREHGVLRSDEPLRYN